MEEVSSGSSASGWVPEVEISEGGLPRFGAGNEAKVQHRDEQWLLWQLIQLIPGDFGG